MKICTSCQISKNISDFYQSKNIVKPWMSWNNYGPLRQDWDDNDQITWTWNIDHIVPRSDLSYESISDENFFKCWDLSNLRSLSSKQNSLDGVTKIRHGKI